VTAANKGACCTVRHCGRPRCTDDRRSSRCAVHRTDRRGAHIGWVTLVAEVVRGSPKLPGALCRDRPRVFTSDAPDDIAEARAICGRCPELMRCAAWSATVRRNRLDGVVAAVYRPWTPMARIWRPTPEGAGGTKKHNRVSRIESTIDRTNNEALQHE
jgi:hypothetical protein